MSGPARRKTQYGITSCRSGSALLEVVVAVSLMAIAGISLLELMLHAQRASTRSQERRADIVSANAFMESVALWPRADLDRHLGSRDEGQYALTVTRITQRLYRIQLALESRAGKSTQVLLETMLFREVP